MRAVLDRLGLLGACVLALGGLSASDGSLHERESRDWPQWGRTPSKNRVGVARNLPFSVRPGDLRPDGSVDLTRAENFLWVARLGSQTHRPPAVSNGRVYIGTNNEGRGDPRFRGDYSLLKCLDAATGKEVWTLTVPKLGEGKVSDWEFLGICSSPAVVGNRVYVLTNRCEVVGLDVNGLYDGNQGFQDEARTMASVGSRPGNPVELKETDADIVWRYDLREELGVHPHNITAGSILVVDDVLYCSTSNGVTYDHTAIPAPKAPALIALDRRIAEKPGVLPRDILVGEEGSGLSRRILHGTWTSPSWGEVGGKRYLFYGGPDGFCYAFDPAPVKDEDGFGILPEIWRHDCNPLEYRFRDGDPRQPPIKYATLRAGPSEIIATPVFSMDRVFVAIGQDPEHRGGPGNLSCLEAATGRKLWEFRIGRTMASCAVADGRVYVPDWDGWLYCIDAKDGTLHWKFETDAEIWSSPLVADRKLFLGDYDGRLTIFDTERMQKLSEEYGPALELRLNSNALVVSRNGVDLKRFIGDEVREHVRQARMDSSIADPIVARDVLYVTTHRRLYAFRAGAK